MSNGQGLTGYRLRMEMRMMAGHQEGKILTVGGQKQRKENLPAKVEGVSRARDRSTPPHPDRASAYALSRRRVRAASGKFLRVCQASLRERKRTIKVCASVSTVIE